MCEAGAVSEFCRVDDITLSAQNSYGSWIYVLDTTGLSPGNYTYSVNANDTSGNLAEIKIGTFALK